MREDVRTMQLLKQVLNFSAQRHLKAAGDLFIYHSDYDGSLKQVEKALALEPSNTRALVLYGDILFCLNRDAEALRAFSKAIEINETLVEAYLSKAGVLEVMGRFREALDLCEAAIAMIGEEKDYLLPNAYDQVIVLMIRLKRYRRAQQVLAQTAQFLTPEDHNYLQSCYGRVLQQIVDKRRSARHDKRQPTPIMALVESGT